MKTILIFRHAEKPDEGKHLSVAGWERAERLVELVETKYGKPDKIFAASNSKESHRPVETAAPLAKRFGLKIDVTYEDKDYRMLSVHLDHEIYTNNTIVIFWHHGLIPSLSAWLGGPEMDKWPDDVFDQYIELKIGVHANVIKEPF